MDDSLRGVWEVTKKEVIAVANDVIENQPLKLSSNVNLSHKTISEIGGRIIEEYISNFATHSNINPHFVVEPLASRGIRDFKVLSDGKEFFVDVKCQHISIRDRTFEFYQKHSIKMKRPGESHPNLISAQKVREFYSDEELKNKDIVFMLIKYDPEIDSGTVNFNIKPIASSQIMLLRDISTNNLTFGRLGRGQIQLSRINAIEETIRTKNQFLELVNELENRPRKQRVTPRKDF